LYRTVTSVTTYPIRVTMQDSADLNLCTSLVASSVLATKFMSSGFAINSVHSDGAAQVQCVRKLPRAPCCTSLVYMVNESCSRFCGKFGFVIFISHDSMKVSPEVTILERSAFLLSTVPQGIQRYGTICRFCTQREVQVFKVSCSNFREALTSVKNETEVSASLNAEQRGS